MNFTLFFDDVYFNKLDEFLTIKKVDPVFPYKEFYIDPKNHKKYGTADIYNFLVNVHFFYYYEQSYFGYAKLGNDYYIIEVDDELTVTVAGDTEVNWLKLLLDDKYVAFKNFCVSTFGIDGKEPNYQALQKIEDQYIDFN